MSQAPLLPNFAFQNVEAARQFLENGPNPSPVAQANLPDLQGHPGYAGPVEQQLGRDYAAQQQEIGWAALSTFDFTIPEAQQPMRAAVQQPTAAGMPAPQAENVRAGHPTHASGYFGQLEQQAPPAPFPAARAAPSGPNNYSLGSCTPEERAEIERRRASEKGQKKLGPRAQAKCRTQAKVVKTRSAARPGPEKRAPDNPWSVRKAWGRHYLDCSDAEWCTEECPLRKFWPEKWEEAKKQTKVRDAVSGEMVFCRGLWSHKYKNRSGYEGARPAPKD